MRGVAAWALAFSMAACDTGVPRPAPIDTRTDACASCRMTVSNVRFAAQVLAPGEEPLFFDDLGCLAAYLRDHGPQPPDAVAYVADHRTGEWAPAATAVFTKIAGLETPMSSGLVAHASAASRDADPAAGRGSPLDAAAIFPVPLPGGTT